MTPPPPEFPSPAGSPFVSDEGSPVSGNFAGSTSSLIPVSGNVSAVGAVSGPWYIEDQRLSINYTRVPDMIRNHFTESDNLSLSGMVPVSGHIIGTFLVCKIYCNHSIRKSYDYYHTSSHQQPQRFELLPRPEDYKGNAYGTSAEFSGTPSNQPLGPAGDINTTQPFTLRRLWQAGDYETAANYTGFSFQFTRSYKADGTRSGFDYADQISHGMFTNWVANEWPDLDEVFHDVSSCSRLYHIGGAYNYNAERYSANMELLNLIDNIADMATYGDWFSGYPVGGSPTAGYQYSIPGYDRHRHDYT